MQTSTRSHSEYSKFVQQIKDGQVQQVTFKGDYPTISSTAYRIEYTLKPEFGGHRHTTTALGSTDELMILLQEQGVDVITPNPSAGNVGGIMGLILTLGALVGTFVWLARSGNAGSVGVGMNVGKSNARVYNQGKTGTTFADVAGVDEAKQELQEIVDFLANSEK